MTSSGEEIRIVDRRGILRKLGLVAGAAVVADAVINPETADAATFSWNAGTVVSIPAFAAVTSSDGNETLYAENTGSGNGVVGLGTYANGVYGGSSNSNGVVGQASSSGSGVQGTSSDGYGVEAASYSGAKSAVYGCSGTATGDLGPVAGIKGNGNGVRAIVGYSYQQNGLWARSDGNNAIWGETATAYEAIRGSSGQGTGVRGDNQNGGAPGLYGVNGNASSGLYDSTVHAAGATGDSSAHPGVVGLSATQVGVMGRSGSSYGVQGITAASQGVRGEATTGYGVVGYATSGVGVLAQATGTALKVTGKAHFSRSGVVTVAAGARAATTASAFLPASAASMVVATIQGHGTNAIAGAAISTSTGKVTVTLQKTAAATTKVAFVILD
jgi:hypothetical protein